MLEKLDETNFLLYAAKHYNNLECYDTVEFYDDLKRFNYIKRLINQYIESGDLKERLILNHIIVLNNLFGAEPTARMLFLKIKNRRNQLKPFLELLGIMPKTIHNIGIANETISSEDIASDKYIEEVLRNI